MDLDGPTVKNFCGHIDAPTGARYLGVMITPKTGFRLPEVTLGQLAALAAKDSPGRPNTTATLCRVIATVYRLEGEPPVPGAPEPIAAKATGAKARAR